MSCWTANGLRQSLNTDQTGSSFPQNLTQTDNPNSPIFLVHILIVKLMAFQAAFRIFTALSNYSTFMLIRI